MKSEGVRAERRDRRRCTGPRPSRSRDAGTWAREWCLDLGRRYEDVITQHAKTAALFPAFIYMEHWVGAAYRELGRYPETLREYEGAQKLLDQPLHGYAITYARMGRTKEAREILARLEAYAKGHYVNPIFFAEIHASLGEKDLAFEWLERAVIDRTAWLMGPTLWPELDPLRSDARYAALVKQIGLPAPRPDDRCPRPAHRRPGGPLTDEVIGDLARPRPPGWVGTCRSDTVLE